MAKELPGSYSEMYPGRFLKADALKGRKVTLTIKAIEGDDLIGENNKTKQEWLVKFGERPLEFVLNKTNAFCLSRMFGGDPHAWVGHKITIYPTKTKFGKEDVDCIRIWGSPDLTEDMEITVPQGRKKRWEAVMHAVKVASTNGHTPAPPTAADPRIVAAWGILDWTEKERAEDRSSFAGTDAEYLVRLNSQIDQMNAA
jgi:hypothetical protein